MGLAKTRYKNVILFTDGACTEAGGSTMLRDRLNKLYHLNKGLYAIGYESSHSHEVGKYLEHSMPARCKKNYRTIRHVEALPRTVLELVKERR